MNGQLVVPFKYHEARSFSAAVWSGPRLQGLGYGYINRSMKRSFPVASEAGRFYHGDFTAKVKQYDRVMTMIDDKGQIVEVIGQKTEVRNLLFVFRPSAARSRSFRSATVGPHIPSVVSGSPGYLNPVDFRRAGR